VKISAKQIMIGAINGMLAELDPRSSYFDQLDMQKETRGEIGGVGVELTIEGGLLKVTSPLQDSPAAKAGIIPSDIVTRVNDERIQGLTLNQAIEKMRGAVNSEVKLTIVRKGQDKPTDVTIKREIIRIKSVRARAEGNYVGYIRITQFNQQTVEGLKKAIDDLRNRLGSDKIKGFVVDLRNNPGGLLDQVISVSDAFLDKGEIVTTRGRNAEVTQRFNAGRAIGPRASH
jgi:carboxyl-terminal processing protease